jgi:hypothetical protein
MFSEHLDILSWKIPTEDSCTHLCCLIYFWKLDQQNYAQTPSSSPCFAFLFIIFQGTVALNLCGAHIITLFCKDYCFWVLLKTISWVVEHLPTKCAALSSNPSTT